MRAASRSRCPQPTCYVRFCSLQGQACACLTCLSFWEQLRGTHPDVAPHSTITHHQMLILSPMEKDNPACSWACSRPLLTATSKLSRPSGPSQEVTLCEKNPFCGVELIDLEWSCATHVTSITTWLLQLSSAYCTDLLQCSKQDRCPTNLPDKLLFPVRIKFQANISCRACFCCEDLYTTPSRTDQIVATLPSRFSQQQCWVQSSGLENAFSSTSDWVLKRLDLLWWGNTSTHCWEENL